MSNTDKVLYTASVVPQMCAYNICRDVMERMIKAGCAATSDFEWLSQLRFVFLREEGPYGMCSVRQTNCQLEFSYEYQVRKASVSWQWSYALIFRKRFSFFSTKQERGKVNGGNRSSPAPTASHPPFSLFISI